MIIELLKIIKILVNLSIRYNVEKYIIKRRRRQTTSATGFISTNQLEYTDWVRSYIYCCNNPWWVFTPRQIKLESSELKIIFRR